VSEAENRASTEDVRRFRSYPAYRNSGVEWLGAIPAHWGVTRTKFAARLRSGHTPSRQHPEYWQDCTIPWFGLADVWQIRDGQIEYVFETSEKISELGLANSAARLLPKGTVMLSRTASVGFSTIMGVDMATTQDFVNWVCGTTLRPEYLLYIFRSMHQEFRRLTMGSTHQTIYMPDVGRFSIAIPPIAEQDQIVSFIRKETARIDALVTKKERLIELLEEKRSALITRAVTKGLDPSVALKDSGVEWLGEIPSHWEAKPNGALFAQRDERGREDLPILEVSIVFGVRMRQFSDEKIEQRSDDLGAYKVAKANDIAFNKMRMWQGAVGATPEDGLVSPDYVVARPLPVTEPGFYARLFRTPQYMAEVYRWSHGIVDDRNRLYWDDFKAIRSPVPPVTEQQAIAAFLSRETEYIDALIAKVRDAIDRLKELRTALISAAVTGKIDVRETPEAD
jgi:type I restriction enzyme S subunit